MVTHWGLARRGRRVGGIQVPPGKYVPVSVLHCLFQGPILGKDYSSKSQLNIVVLRTVENIFPSLLRELSVCSIMCCFSRI